MNKQPDRLDRMIDDAARRLGAPVDVPRERMWERIAAARDAARTDDAEPRPTAGERRRWSVAAGRWWPAAAAALLVLGFGLGRLEWPSAERVGPATTPTIASGEDVGAGTTTLATTTGWRTAADRMLLRAEALLTSFDTASAGAPMAEPVPRWAGLLLDETRLLMDSPAADDPELASLLDDLELVLAQISQLRRHADDAASETEYTLKDDRTWIADGLAKRATLSRLRERLQPGEQERRQSL